MGIFDAAILSNVFPRLGLWGAKDHDKVTLVTLQLQGLPTSNSGGRAPKVHGTFDIRNSLAKTLDTSGLSMSRLAP